MDTQTLNGDSNGDVSKGQGDSSPLGILHRWCLKLPEATISLLVLGKYDFKRYLILLTLFPPIFYPLRTLSAALPVYITL